MVLSLIELKSFFGGNEMKQSDRISYEKPELTDYRFWGVVSGDPSTPSNPGDQEDPIGGCDDFIDN